MAVSITQRSGSSTPTLTQFTLANNQTSPVDVTGFLVNNTTNNGFVADFSIIRSTTTGSAIANEQTSISSHYTEMSPTDGAGQRFVSPGNFTITSVTVNLASAPTGTVSGPIVISVYSDSGGTPGTIIGTSNSVDAATLTTTAADVNFTFSSGPSISSGQTYYCVVDPAGVTFTGGTSGIFVSTNNPGSSNAVTGHSGGFIDRPFDLYQIVNGSFSPSELDQTGTFYGSYSFLNSAWMISDPIGSFNNAGVVFSITAGGQLQYTSSNQLGTIGTQTLRFLIRGL